MTTRPTSDLLEQAKSRHWYHALELAPGFETQGIFDVHHATPEQLGTFDVVFCGSVLIHLRDQLLALERIAGLCTKTFTSHTWRKMIRTAGFERVEEHSRFDMKSRQGYSVRHVVHHAHRS